MTELPRMTRRTDSRSARSRGRSASMRASETSSWTCTGELTEPRWPILTLAGHGPGVTRRPMTEAPKAIGMIGAFARAVQAMTRQPFVVLAVCLAYAALSALLIRVFFGAGADIDLMD